MPESTRAPATTSVRCDGCSSAVEALRYSDQQLMIQWSDRSREVCPHLNEGQQRWGTPDPCPFLRASVDRAIAEEAIPITLRHEEPVRGHW